MLGRIFLFSLGLYGIYFGCIGVLLCQPVAGERLEFRLRMLGLTVGNGALEVLERDCASCLYLRAWGKTQGAARMISKVDDRWGCYYHLDRKVPSYSYRFIKEGRYRRNEEVWFEAGQAKVYTYTDENKNEIKEQFEKKIVPNTLDILSVYAFIRTKSLSGMERDDFFTVPLFYKDTLYDIRVYYLGEDVLRTKFGRKKAHVITPVFPKKASGEIQAGKGTVKVWISADEERWPLKATIKMWIGRIVLTTTRIFTPKKP